MRRQLRTLLALTIIFAVVIACKKNAEPSVKTGDFVQLFDGSSLQGWDADTAYWHAKDGVLVGEVKPAAPLKTNNFISWTGGLPADFELTAEFRISETGNSGINYRSEKVDTLAHALRGYQADIDGKIKYTGQNYEERGRTTLAYRGEAAIIHVQEGGKKSLREGSKNNAWIYREVTRSLGRSDSLRELIKSNDWNTCRIIARGNLLQHYINGILMSEVTDNDSVNRKSSGLIGLQLHVGSPMKVEYRKILLRSR